MHGVKRQLEEKLTAIAAELGHPDTSFTVSEPSEEAHGDYASNIALVLGKKMGKNPRETAEEIKKLLGSAIQDLGVDRIEVAGPGFINFHLSKAYLITQLSRALNPQEEIAKSTQINNLKLKLLVEFAHPNTHKEFHIGHLRNITLGEAIVRLLEANGSEVFRANYQGDIGMHVAKALYGLLQSDTEVEDMDKKPLEERAKFLGKVYAQGSKAFEEDEQAKAEIVSINKKIYLKDPQITVLWEKTRKWSLDYFDSIYKRLGTHYDRLFFESQTYEEGKKIVLAHVGDVFKKDQGAIIFDGEPYGLHKRVFITSEGNPTYEAKDIGLAPLQYETFPFDKAIHVVGPEQAGYFKVVFKALELVDPRFVGKEMHLPYGFVQLKEGKMSSRQGNVIPGLWLLDEAKRKIQDSFKDMDEETAEAVAVGAVKYSMLKFSTASDMSFSFDESISLEGNSGPYLQYTYARTCSVLAKFKSQNSNLKNEGLLAELITYCQKVSDKKALEPEEFSLLRTLNKFGDKIEESSTQFAPNILCNFLFDLAQKYNLFYQKHAIIGSESEQMRLALTAATGNVVKNGLHLLGIQAPEKM